MQRLRRLRLLLVMFCVVTVVHAQPVENPFIDSLEYQLSSSQDVDERIDLLSELGREYIFINPKTAFDYLQESAALLPQSNDSLLHAKVYRNLGSLLLLQNNYILGLRYVTRAKEIYNRYDDSLGMANCDLSLGLIYEALNQYNEAIHYSLQAFETFKRLNETERMGVITNNLASQYLSNGQYDSTEYFLNLSLSTNQSIRNYPVLVSNYRLGAKLYFELADLTSSKNLANSAFRVAQNLDNQVNQQALTESSLIMAKIYQLEGKQDSTFLYLTQAEKFAMKNRYFDLLAELQLTYLSLPENWIKSGDKSRYISRYKAMIDSIQSVQFQNELLGIELVEESLAAKKSIDELQQINEVDQKIIDQQQKIIILVVSLLFVVLILIFVLFWSYRNTRRINEQLLNAKQLLEQKTTQISNNRLILRSLLDAVPLFLALTDKDGKMVVANKAYNKMFGINEGEVEGQHYSKILPPNVLEKHQEYINRAFSGEVVKFEENYPLEDGKVMYFYGKYTPIIQEGELIYLAFFNLNITRLKEVENALKESNETKDKLMSILAHDFKGPINTVLGVSEILTKDIDALSRDELRTISIEMNKSVKRTLKFADNLLQWARSQMNQIATTIEPIALEDIIAAVLEEVNPTLELKKITVKKDLDSDVIVEVDKNQMQLVFRNLLTNAIKFSKSGGEVIIQTELKKNQVEVSIQDSGIGMDKETLDNLFSKYTRSQDGTMGEKGTGLGLMLVSEFVNKNGGKIWVESEPDKGTIFYFTLNLSK